MKNMIWVGPYRIDELLKNCLDYKIQKWPQDNKGVYVVTRYKWSGVPSKKSKPLYVGGNTSKSGRFRIRIGDLIADIYGFFCDDEIGHHSGGITLHNYCKRNKLHPNELYIGWAKNIGCNRCAENIVYEGLSPSLNKIKPSSCDRHRTLL